MTDELLLCVVAVHLCGLISGSHPRSLPPDVFATLAALVMDPPQLAAELRRAEAQHANEEDSAGDLAAGPMAPSRGQSAAAAGDAQQEAAAAAGLSMAVLTSAARLLEAKASPMTNDDGNMACWDGGTG